MPGKPKVWVVETEDGETRYFTNREAAHNYSLLWVSAYSQETGIPVTELEELGLVYIHEEEMAYAL